MKIDKDRADKAFELYWDLGENRTHQQVADRLKVGLKRVQDWSQRHNWTGRLMERLDEIRKRNQEIAIQNVSDQRPQFRIGLHNEIGNFLKSHPQIKTWSQFSIAMTHYRLESGEPTTHEKRTIDGEINLNLKNDKRDLFLRARALGQDVEKRLQDAFEELLRIEREISEFEAAGGRQPGGLGA
jgi:hypothetical protein